MMPKSHWEGGLESHVESEYKLPVCDTQEERRNFDGCIHYENMLPLWDQEGTTDTDVDTHKQEEQNYNYRRRQPAGGYTNIYGLKEKHPKMRSTKTNNKRSKVN